MRGHINACGGNDDGVAGREIRFAVALCARRNALSPIPAVNAASVSQRRPPGIPGGKT
ncbi:MAG: hypothetical protein OXL41_08385 [Nitrospinae bacterium]|nr:hypothetical protein [Nitrospinota bacterium]